MKLIKKFLHWILLGIGLIGLIQYVTSRDNDLLVGSIIIIVLGLYFYKKPLKVKEPNKQSRNPLADETRTRLETFNLKGIYYEGRQENIKFLNIGDELIPRYYEYNGEDAIELFLDDFSVGVVPKELASLYTINDPNYIVHRVYEFADGGIGAEIRVE